MKKTRTDNHRVVVDPKMWRSISKLEHADYVRACETIAAEIKRHVDDVDSVRTEWDTLHECEHCGHKWTEESDTYNGGCCDKDEEPNPEGWEDAAATGATP